MIILSYIKWHYSIGISDFMHTWRIVCWFIAHFFSLSTLAKTLFHPWRRLHEGKKGSFDIENFLTNIVVNILMRVVGFVLRSIVIVIGLFLLALMTVLGSLFFVFWIIAPIILPLSIIYGISFLI